MLCDSLLKLLLFPILLQQESLHQVHLTFPLESLTHQALLFIQLSQGNAPAVQKMSRRSKERSGTGKERLYPLHKSHTTQTSTVYIWSTLQILDGASANCQDPDTVLKRVESMIESTINSNEFRSKEGTVVRIPDADFNIVPRSVTKNTTPCSICIRTTTICVNNQGLIGNWVQRSTVLEEEPIEMFAQKTMWKLCGKVLLMIHLSQLAVIPAFPE
ncbi:hypothetical protein TNCV_506841 [Trichonephila clavipes]|nr:hypothetical protein TNCV_506841 [Trichonephila clavipes]